jgi:hypothetical protein
MHALNRPSLIGNEFYTRPNSASSTGLEYLYNKLFSLVPVRLDFSEEFNMSCLKVIEENFDVFSSVISKIETRLLEENIWIGKPGTPYKNAMIGTSFKTEDGDITHSSSSLFGRSSTINGNLDKDFLSKMYVHVKAVTEDREQAALVSSMLDSHTIVKCSKMYVLSNTYGELGLSALPMEMISPDIVLNYGEDFKAVNKDILESLNTKKSGLYLFHGAPGTGKSTYIKYLCSGVLNRKIAYIPVGLIHHLTAPDMLPLLVENKDLILVIEDAEKALLSRETSADSQLVSTILNLTDGFLGDAMNTSIVATFNTGKENIDAALLRKGRLRVCHEFKKLTIEQAKKLAGSLGHNEELVTAEMTLADIYYMDDAASEYGKQEEKRVGFF